MPSRFDDEDRWLRRFHPHPESELELFCFPHAGGAATYYFPLSKLLTPEIEVRAVQYPGRQERRHERCVDNIPELADQIFAVLGDRGDRPFAFFGHSMGALLAFEVALRYERSSMTGPVRLFASGRGAPSRAFNANVHTRSDAGIIGELRQAGGTDERFLNDPELVATILGVTRNDYRAIETYTWTGQSPLTCPITVLIGDQDARALADDASAWAEHSTADVDLRVFPGGHFYLDEHRADVARTISSTLALPSRVSSPGGALGAV